MEVEQDYVMKLCVYSSSLSLSKLNNYILYIRASKKVLTFFFINLAGCRQVLMPQAKKTK